MGKYRIGISYLCFLFLLITIMYSNINISVDSFNQEDQIEIEIKGEVENDRVITVDRGSTLNDVLDDVKLADDADLSTLSLLKPLKDKEIIVIPKDNESELISINSACVNELCQLPGIGEATALKIIEYRDINGGFKELEEIKSVKGIGDKKYEQIKDLICL